jgi:hypothetical protein
MVAPGYCHLIFVSGLGVGFSTLLGGDLEVFFCFLLGESKCGAGLVVVVGARFVRLVYSSLLAIGVDKIQVGGVAGDGGSCLLRAPIGVEMLLFPFGGLKLQVVDSAGDGGCFFWAGSFGSEGARSRLFLLLRAPTLKLLMFFQGFRCVLSVASRRWLLQLNKVWASSFKLGEELVFHTGVLIVDGEQRRVWMGVVFVVSSLLSCAVIFLLSRALSEIWGCTVMLF